MKFTLFCLGAFCVAAMLFMGEIAWLVILCVLIGRAAFASFHVALRCALIASGLAILAAHCAGYKIYGSATVHDNRPLFDSPRSLGSFAAPNIVVSDDGTRSEVRGITFTPELLAMPAENLQQIFSRESNSLLIQEDRNSPSGIVFQRRCNYWCGNTFFPTFTPSRLPRYSKSDLGRYLVTCKLATSEQTE